MQRLRCVFVHHGACIPSRRLGCLKPWLQQLPDDAASRELERRTIVFPRGGDGYYACPSTTVADGFPWGQLTGQGASDMRELGRALGGGPGPPVRPDRCLVRSACSDVAVQSAQALAVGVADAAASRHVTEIFFVNGEDLVPDVAAGQPGFPSAPGGAAAALADTAGDVEALRGTAVGAIRARFPDAPGYDPEHLPWEQLCEALACLREDPVVGAEVSKAVGDCAFALWSSPFHVDPGAAARVLGALLSDMLKRIDEEAGQGSASEGPDAEVQIFVVPAETLVVLCATLGLSRQLAERSNGILGAWPAYGARLELELVFDSGGEPCVRLAYDGDVLTPSLGRELLPWSLLRPRLAQYLD